MNIEEFFSHVQVYGYDDYFKALITSYMHQEKIIPTHEGRTFYQIFNYDAALQTDTASDIRPLLSYLLQLYKAKPQTISLADTLNTQKNYMTISSQVFGSAPDTDLVHKLFFSIKSTDINAFLMMLIADLNALNVGYRILTKEVNRQNSGEKDAIVLLVSSENLEKVLNILTDKYQSIMHNPNPMVAAIEKLGYASFCEESGKDMSEVLGETIIACIDDALTDYLINNPLDNAGTNALETLSNTHFDDIARIKLMREIAPKFDLIADILKRIPEKCLLNGIDIDNMFMSKRALEELHQLYNIVVPELEVDNSPAQLVDKYAFLNEPESFFTRTMTMLDGECLTVLDYLERNEVLKKIPENVTITILDDSRLDRAEFIKYALQYAHRYPDFAAIMDVFIRSMSKSSHKK